MPVKQRGKSSKITSGSNEKSETSSERNGSTQERSVETPLPQRSNFQRILTRICVIAAILFVVYFMEKDKMQTLVSQREEVTEKAVSLPCSQDYADELKQFPGCVPQKCGRVVFDRIVSPSEVAALLNIAQRGFFLGSSTGGASILDLHSGALSHGNGFVNIYKLEEAKNMFSSQDFVIYRQVKNKIKAAILKHFSLDRSSLYLTHPTFFSRITSAPAKTIHDEYWHPHVDKETYESFHYTSLLYLTNYGLDFEGGRFVFIDKGVNKTVEPRAGRVSAFTSGSENRHQVEKVKSGTRFALTVSFTCDPKHSIKDPDVPQ